MKEVGFPLNTGPERAVAYSVRPYMKVAFLITFWDKIGTESKAVSGLKSTKID